MIKINPSHRIKRGCSTINTIHSDYDFKSYGTQFLCHPLDLCRPHARNLFNLEILVNMHMYFQMSTKPYSNGTTCYDLQHFIGCGQIFGGSMEEMEKKLLSIFQYLILGPSGNEVDTWRACTPFGTLSDAVMEFKHYKSYYSWPNVKGQTFENILNNLLNVLPKENFEWNCNSSWKSRARAVIGKYFTFFGNSDENRYFTYHINYSTANREASSWEVKIRSEPDETFVDFVLRLNKHNWVTKEGRNHLEQIGSQYSSSYKII